MTNFKTKLQNKIEREGKELKFITNDGGDESVLPTSRKQKLAYKSGASLISELLVDLVEAAEMVSKYGYGVNVERNMVITNTGVKLDVALKKINEFVEE